MSEHGTVVAFCASDQGPRETLAELMTRLPGRWLGDFRDQAEAGAVLAALGTKLLIVGTSDTPHGRQLEIHARIAACAKGVPCIVIEDFPGNYTDVPAAAPAAIVVDCMPAKAWAENKTPSVAAIHVCPAIRYDSLRRRLAQLRTPREVANAVLWVGQPETQDALATLAGLAPELRRLGVALWFRAHPRDDGYALGAYRELLTHASDLTHASLQECLERTPRLVITQFSSVAIEAGFWGIPALNVLFAEIGGTRLRSKKGYSVPPWCEAGAAFFVTEQAALASILEVGLNSYQARKVVMQRFDEWFSVTEEGGPRLVKLLYNQGLLQRRRPS